jgi:hypothetical protein
MTASSIYLKHEIAIKDLLDLTGSAQRASLGNKWLFVGIDMAPVDSLESGVAIIDRDRYMMRMEKFNENEDLLLFLDNLGSPENIIVALDIPKSLSISSKWRQQQIKMHPLRLRSGIPAATHELVPTDRFAERAKAFYQAVDERGILMFNFFTAHAKLRYDLNVPFRHRSPLGCRTLQAALRQKLGIKDVPSNLMPSSVLDALIGAYTAWMLHKGREGYHFKLYRDDENRLYIDPLKRFLRPLRGRYSVNRPGQ